MKIYSNTLEETIYILKRLKLWLNSKLITEKQYETSVKKLPHNHLLSGLFFRILFAAFTLFGVQSVTFFILWFLDIKIRKDSWWIFILFSGIYYLIAEYLVKKFKLYRHGVEEALIFLSLIMFVYGTTFTIRNFNINTNIGSAFIFVFVSLALLWVYARFGYIRTFMLALPCMGAIPFVLELSQTFARLTVITIFSLFLYINIKTANNNYNFSKFNNSIIRAVLFLGIYLMTNLRLGAIRIPSCGVSNHALRAYAGFTPFVYWASYVLGFAIPALGIYYGIKLKQRAILIISSIALMISIITNKDYLGIRHYEWDAIIFGILLISSALLIIRYLSKGENKTRNGFTYRNLLKPEDHGINIAVIASAFTVPEVSGDAGRSFGGGESGGGGASRNF